MNIATFERVGFAYPSAPRPALFDLDWRIEAGEFVVVSGPSGSGKSTMLRCLNGLVPHFSGGKFAGAATIDGLDTRQFGPRVLSRSVGFVFQEPEAQSVAAIVEDELAFGMEQLGVPRATMRVRVEETLDLLGIAALRRRELATLSGGERQRVAIAAVLTLHPRLLVLDEPTSQLDPWGAEDVIAALKRLNEDLGLTIVLAEHRLERVLGEADRLRVLDGAGVIDDGPPREVVARIRPEMTPPMIRLARFLDWNPLPLTIKEGRAARALDPRSPRSPDTSPPVPIGTPVLAIRGLTSGYGARSVLKRLDFEVRPGELVALMGRNGSGKTTLLRSVIGFQKPLAGAIQLAGRDIAKSDPSELAKYAGYLPQRPSSLLFSATVREELRFTLKHRSGSGLDVDQLLDDLDLTELADRNPRDLSAGEQERTALAAILAGNPPLLLLDEPTRGMDAPRKRALGRLLTRLAARGTAIVMATHDVELAAAVATRVALLGDGEIVADGSPRDVLSGSLAFAPQINKLYGDGFLTVDDVLHGLDLPLEG
jgi:energy-coupling factor transporter ATP-binding protein EcfA2